MMLGSCNKDYVTRGLSLEKKSYVALFYYSIIVFKDFY